MITFKIKRYNPEKQAEPYFEEFQLDVQDDLTLLDCMNEIKWTLDGSLTYRMSCRSAICGSCAVKANGHAILACQRQVRHLVKDDDTIVLEPLGNMKPIKDLAVDFKPFWDKIDKVKPYLQPEKKAPETINSESTLHDQVLRSDAVRAVVAGEIRGARTLRITPKGDDSFEVVLALDPDTVRYILRAVRQRG